MKIVHIAPNAPYNEGWSYQDNYLPRFQAQLGHDVMMIITNQEHRDGRLQECACSDGVTKDGFRVVRLKQKRIRFPMLKKLPGWLDVYEMLKREKPDFIFYHGLVSATIFQVCKYKNKINPNCVIVQDNHLDINIGFGSIDSVEKRIQRLIFRTIFRLTRKHISKVYGVTPWRQKYAQEYFHVPADMTDVLIMGAADDKIHFDEKASLRSAFREKYNVRDDELFIVTGAKIDERKKIHLLMEAVNQLNGVKLVVFGNVLDDIKERFEKQLSDKVIWAGFISSDEAYDYFLAADLVMFPGQHSVFWEQACACKVPCVFSRWEGMEHVDNGGNSEFIDEITVDSLRSKVEELRFTPKYARMKQIAESDKTDVYLYSNIAEKSLECAAKVD